MGAKGCNILTRSVRVARHVRMAPNAAGVGFLNHRRPSVRLKSEGKD